MSKPKKISAAERAVRNAVEEETKELRAELEAERSKVARLTSVLQNLSIQANAAIEGVLVPVLQRALQVHAEIPPQGPSADLAPQDAMGEGRWV